MNHVIVEGTVTNDIWNYGSDSLFRLRRNGGGNGGMFFTVRFRNLPLDIKAGQRVAIVGELISREQRVSLTDFVSRATRGEANKPDAELVEKLAKQLEPVNRSYTEILAKEIRYLA